jgi:type II secretory pathway pseudopilin PulG
MEKKVRFSILEMMVVIAIILILISIIMPILEVIRKGAQKTKTIATAKSIGLIMVSYAEEDIRANKMPYPLAKGKEKVWGNSKECWSTSVAELLFSQQLMKLGGENQLKSAGSTGEKYAPMLLADDTKNKNKFWKPQTELDFHLYCDKNLTSNVSGKLVLVATYDNDDIRNCQFDGGGWVIFFADKSVEYVKRAKLNEFDPNANTPIVSINAVEGSITVPGMVLRKDIPAAEGGPGTFGSNLSGGSAELMGRRDSDPVYKALAQ